MYKKLQDDDVIMCGDEAQPAPAKRTVERIVGLTLGEARMLAGAPTLRVRRPIGTHVHACGSMATQVCACMQGEVSMGACTGRMGGLGPSGA